MDISEKAFEAAVEKALLDGGYRKRVAADYDRALCFDPEMLFQFIYTTQPREWEKLKAQHGAEVKQKFLRRLVKEIERRGTLDILRKGVKDYGCKFQLAYFAPASTLNVEHARAYRGNILSVIRQLKYSEKSDKSLDLVLFLNVYGRMLLRKLPAARDRLPVEITENINMDSYRIQKMTEGKISLAGGEGVLEPLSDLGAGRRGKPEFEPLSQIIQDINAKYGTSFTEADKVFFAELETRLSTNQTLIESARVNSKENLQLAYNNMFKDELQNMIDANFEIYKRITDDEDFGKFIMSRMFELVYARLQQGEVRI